MVRVQVRFRQAVANPVGLLLRSRAGMNVYGTNTRGWHDWLEDAVAFAVADDRYTGGVANLRATVRVERLE